jgi:hypothetical protein
MQQNLQKGLFTPAEASNSCPRQPYADGGHTASWEVEEKPHAPKRPGWATKSKSFVVVDGANIYGSAA